MPMIGRCGTIPTGGRAGPPALFARASERGV